MKVGYVYKLVSDLTDDIYVGSTMNKYLSNRLGQHHGDFKRWKEGKRGYCSAYDLYELGQVKIECLEVVKYEDRQELFIKEREWIEKLLCINKRIPTRTHKEWREANIDDVRQKDRERDAIRRLKKRQNNISAKIKDEPIL